MHRLDSVFSVGGGPQMGLVSGVLDGHSADACTDWFGKGIDDSELTKCRFAVC